jgi:alcohol dehydrogenase class IV
MTLTLPRRLSVNSGVNAIAHAVEALYANDATVTYDFVMQER